MSLLVDLEDQVGNFKMKKPLFFFTLIISFSCSNDKDWVLLLNENDLNGWHYYNDNGNKIGWSVENGILSFDPTLAKFKVDSLGNILIEDDGSPKIERNDIFFIY